MKPTKKSKKTKQNTESSCYLWVTQTLQGIKPVKQGGKPPDLTVLEKEIGSLWVPILETLQGHVTITKLSVNTNNNNGQDINDNDSFVITFFDKSVTVSISKKSERTVINLSCYNLTQYEMEVLRKGLKFCPTPGEPLMGQILDDIAALFRRMRLRAFFNDPEDLTDSILSNQTLMDMYLRDAGGERNDPIEEKFQERSTFDPKIHDGLMNAFFELVVREVNEFTPRNPRNQNLTKEEKEALQNLTNNPNITIKKADKGSAIVVMDTEDYIKEAERQLSDRKFYIPKDVDLSDQHREEITKILDEMLAKGEITAKNHKYLAPTKETTRTAKFYFLPKIHKKEVKGRPIISGNGCPTERISAFVDEHIKDEVKKLPSYVKDTTDFIQKVEGITSKNEIILVTMDVTSLYTNIPNHEGIVSVTDMLRENYSKKVSLKSLQKLLKAVLHMNNFEFNGKHYLQIGGTAMGTRVAPSYANIFMGKLEQKLLAEAQKIGLVPLVYLRFIDDLFMVWDLGEAKLKRFIEFSNEFHSTIKFTAEYSREVVNYLDTKVKVKTDHNGTSTIYFDLYTKDTDTHSYLHYTSSHPIHCKKGGPYGEFLRLRRNCTNMSDFEKHAQSRVKDYIARGYPEKDLHAAKEKAKAKDRKELLKPK